MIEPLKQVAERKETLVESKHSIGVYFGRWRRRRSEDVGISIRMSHAFFGLDWPELTRPPGFSFLAHSKLGIHHHRHHQIVDPQDCLLLFQSAERRCGLQRH